MIVYAGRVLDLSRGAHGFLVSPNRAGGVRLVPRYPTEGGSGFEVAAGRWAFPIHRAAPSHVVDDQKMMVGPARRVLISNPLSPVTPWIGFSPGLGTLSHNMSLCPARMIHTPTLCAECSRSE